MSYISEIQDTIPRVLNYFWKDLLQKNVNQFRIEETHATQFEIQTNLVCYSKEVILVGEMKWNDILAYNSFIGDSLIKMNEKLTALFIGIRCVPNCEKHFTRPEGENSRTQIGFNTHIYEGSNKMRFQYCMNSKKSLLYIRTIQGHAGGNLIAPELMGRVAIPDKWKEFLFHRGCS